MIYENCHLSVWMLKIKAGASTSLHCHPDKKTGLIILTGEAMVRFLSDDIPMHPFSKTLIREGVFHSTTALSPEGVTLLEIETPTDKDNLVRMEDKYGRKGTHYESIEQCVPRSSSEIWVANEIGASAQYKDYEFRVEYLTSEGLAKLSDDDVIIILNAAGIITEEDQPISKRGDAIKVKIVRRLVDSFQIAPDAYVLTICRKHDEAK